MDGPSHNKGHEGSQTDPATVDQPDIRKNSFPSEADALNSIRAVTPEPGQNGAAGSQASAIDHTAVHATRGFGATSPTQSSPRSIPGGERRRQGIVFSDASYEESFDSAASSPPGQALQQQGPQSPKSPLRPRTHTVDGALASSRSNPLPAGQQAESRVRVGSLSSSGSQPHPEAEGRTPPVGRDNVGFLGVSPARPPDLKVNVAPSNKKDKSSNKRLLKRASSRPSSPLISPPPSIDSLPSPIPTDDANKILLLMKTLCGRMRGEVEYQSDAGGPWYGPGICYIDEERGSLLFDGGQSGSIHIPLVGDLRGLKVLPVDDEEYPGEGRRCLQVLGRSGLEVCLRTIVPEEVDLWLASLLCWQQLRPSAGRPAPPSRTSSGSPIPGATRTDNNARQRGSSTTGPAPAKDAAIIKVGKVMLWDKGLATSPRAIVKRPSTRDLRSGTTAWTRVSCLLQDNGEFKLMAENDVTVLSVIELSQLSRRAVQQLDKSVLDEEFCIAIFPIYSSTSRQLSIFRPVYLAFDTKVLFEVWFVLLRAYAVPDLYGVEASSDQVVELGDTHSQFEGQLFRVEKTIDVRVTEAKLRKPTLPLEITDKHARDRDPLVGNYLAEVILDGEVRARTTIQTDTKNPFWRDATNFTDLPAALPPLSVIIKRVDGNLESISHQLQASLGLAKTGNLAEAVVGSVDIPLATLERRKDHEQWHPIHDERGDTIGTLYAKVSHDELVILPADSYQELSDLLHKFSTGLTNGIALAMPSALRRLAETFLNIFQVSGKSAEWLMALVEEEIDGLGNPNSIKRLRFSRRLKSNESNKSASDREQIVRDMSKSLAGEANLLFRGNTLLTQALEFHMRRLGKEYLESVLTDKIFEINELNPDCEVDPSRIQRVEEQQHHWAVLLQLTTEIWECIATSASAFPGGIKAIFKYIRAVADDRYGDFLRTVSYTSVSGFLFLRFICPAILNPKLFGLLRDNPRPQAQRSLTLIAKGLQALANLNTFGKKESWMEPMNKFVSSYKQPFKDFIDQICDVPADPDVAFGVHASYSTPVQILGRLSPVSREGFPSLPYLIDHPRNCASLVKLWLENNRSTMEESIVFEGELARFHKLCQSLQSQSDGCFQKIEGYRAGDGHSVDELAESLEKASLLDASNVSFGSHSWADTDPYRGAYSSGSEMEGSDRPAKGGWDYKASNALRQISESAVGSTIRGKGRDGRNPRSFLSGLIGKSRDKALSPSSAREKSRDNKEDKSGRGMLGFTEAWQGESTSRH